MALVNIYVKEFDSKEEAMAFKNAHGITTIHRYNDDFLYLSEAEYFEDEQLPNMELESSILYVDDTNPRSCKIYRFIQVPELDTTEVPKGHDFGVKGLTSNLFPVRSIIKGELQNVKWYADIEKEDLVIDETMVYERDVLGFALKRTTTRTWYREDGSAHYDTKISIKEYDDLAQIQEGERRRGNLIKAMQKPILGLLGATLPSMPQEKIAVLAAEFYQIFGFQFEGSMQHVILIGRNFMKKHQTSFSVFKGESNKQIIFDIQSDTAVWLDNVINAQGQTVRDYIVEQLTI